MADSVVITVPVPYSNSKKLELTVNADDHMVTKVEEFINEKLDHTYKLAYPISQQDAIEKYLNMML